MLKVNTIEANKWDKLVCGIKIVPNYYFFSISYLMYVVPYLLIIINRLLESDCLCFKVIPLKLVEHIKNGKQCKIVLVFPAQFISQLLGIVTKRKMESYKRI